MLKKLLSILFVMVMVGGLYSQSIPSGTGRIEALGYNPFILDAATDINRNPAWSGSFRNYIFGDLGRATGSGTDFYLDNQYAGINFAIGKQMTLGAVFNKDESFWGLFNDTNSSITPNGLSISAPVVPLKILFSYSSKTMTVGVAPYFAMWSKDDYGSSGSTVNEWKNSSLTFGGTLGILYKLKGPNWFEVAADVKLNKFKQDYTATNPTSETIQESQGGLQLSAFARGWFMVHKASKINFVPYVEFSMFNWNPNLTTSPTPTNMTQQKFKHFSLNGGIGVNLPVLDDGLLAGGLSVGTSSYDGKPVYKSNGETVDTLEVKSTAFIFPQFNIGLEWTFTDWLTARLGYMRSVASRKNDNLNAGSIAFENYSTFTELSSPDQIITTGLGFQFDRFSFDGTVGEKFYQRSPYIISGNQTDLFGVISVSYNFNK